MEPFAWTVRERARKILWLLIDVSILVGGVVLARRNLLLGRGDRRGAFRLAVLIFCAKLITWVLWTNGCRLPLSEQRTQSP